MNITKDVVVSIDYTLTNDTGDVIDSSKGAAPLVYIQGHNNLIPGLEKELEGKAKGDKLTVKVSPAQGYGEYNEKLVQSLKKDQFNVEEEIAIGMKFQAETPNGQMMLLTVKEVKEEEIIVDGNHELAGMTLHFDVEVIETRAATEKELSHGHVHAHAEGGCCGAHDDCDREK